jgi:hypothetical protein
MTVRVAAEQTFRMSKADMSAYVQDVLYHDPLYRRVSEGNSGAYFSAVVQPNVPLVLGTDITVTLDESDGTTRVQVSTLSQPMIMGDVFGMYDHYLEGFFGKLDKAIELERHENMTLDDVRFLRSNSWKWKWLVVVAMILAVFLIIVPFLHLPTTVYIILPALMVLWGRAWLRTGKSRSQ